MTPDASQVLDRWYAAHPAVRRLLAISESQRMRVVVTLGPTNDGDEIYPAWLANAGRWTRELELRLGVPVRLEVGEQPACSDPVAELFWRDASAPS